MSGPKSFFVFTNLDFMIQPDRRKMQVPRQALNIMRQRLQQTYKLIIRNGNDFTRR